MSTRSFLTTALFVALFIVPGRAEPPSPSPRAIKAKRAHLSRVLSELETRDTAHLTPAQRARRVAALRHLRAYAVRGQFPLNTELPQFDLPYFIDAYGTRCALAYVVDQTGNATLTRRLADLDNHAWVADLLDDSDLTLWLRRHGMSATEAAYIQAPSLIDPPSDVPDESEQEDPEPTPEPDPEPIPTPDTGPAPTPTPDTGSGRPTRTRRGRATADAGSWSNWWRYNRDAFVNLRERYHAAASTTPLGLSRGGRAWRPSMRDRTKVLLPALAKLSNGNQKIRASALMAWSMASQSDAAPAVAGTRDYLRDPESRYRDLMLLALGVSNDADAQSALVAILQNTKAGRRAIDKKSQVPASTRAFAAVALGIMQSVDAVPALLSVASDKKVRTDVRTAAMVSLGLCAEHATADVRASVAATLTKHFKAGRWDDAVLAAMPMTMIRLRDADARAAVLRTVSRFRGAADVRASCALALGMSEGALQEDVVNALLATSRRDPDVYARRFATIALGELCLRDSSAEANPTVVRRIRRHFLGTLDGHFKARRAMEWHLLATGLFVRRFPAAGADLVRRLVRVAERGGARDERAAAALALGLSEHVDGRAPLLKLLDRSKDRVLRGAVAEALGLMGAKEARMPLRKILLKDKSNAVRYQAALGLGYLADGSMIAPLVKQLASTGSGQTRAALTRVLGQLGDRRAIAGLIELADDESNPRSVRERALGALGMIARESDASWTLPFRRGNNFEAATPTVRMVLGIF